MTHKTALVAVVSPLEKVMVLKRSPLFENTPENILSAIVPIITEHPCELGEVLFEKGELGTCMYVIYSGTVEIFDGKTKLAQFGANDVFGELALLDTETRSASAVVADPTLLFRIDQEDFYDLMEERPELLKSVLSILCKRIRLQNDRLRRMEKDAG
jgi:CRP-like cAMP-binding protein